MADAGGEHLRGQAVASEDLGDVRDDVHAAMAGVVQPPDEGADVRDARLGAQERLVHGEAQGLVDGDALLRHRRHGSKAVTRAGQLDDDVGMPRCNVPRLLHHGVNTPGGHFDGDGAVDDAGNLQDGALVAVSISDALAGCEGGVGGDSRHYAELSALPHFVEVGSVQKQAHGLTSLV